MIAEGTDTVISLNTNGAPSAGWVQGFQLSADGGRLAFLSAAGDLVEGVEGGRSQVYVASTSSRTNQLVSRSLPNGDANASDCLNVVASDDLSVVAFSQSAGMTAVPVIRTWRPGSKHTPQLMQVPGTTLLVRRLARCAWRWW